MHNLKRFFISSFRFLSRATFLSLPGIVLILLHNTNLYAEHIKTHLPESMVSTFDRVITIIDKYALFIAFFIILSAILYTFYEVDRETRDRQITKKLKSFYIDLNEYLNREITDVDSLTKLKEEVRLKDREIYNWVKNNMDRSSLIQLTHQSLFMLGNIRNRRPEAFNDDHSALIDKIIFVQACLAHMIEKEVWM